MLVIVDDRNEFTPDFDQLKYFTSISEDATPGTYVTSVKATDEDGTGVWYVEVSTEYTFCLCINSYNGDLS